MCVVTQKPLYYAEKMTEQDPSCKQPAQEIATDLKKALADVAQRLAWADTLENPLERWFRQEKLWELQDELTSALAELNE